MKQYDTQNKKLMKLDERKHRFPFNNKSVDDALMNEKEY
jgi:hypothetical protein